MKVRKIEGNIHIDERGEVGFINDYDFHGVKRFYTIRNYKSHFIRAPIYVFEKMTPFIGVCAYTRVY